MQVEVIPAFRLPRTKASFTYSVPKELGGSIRIGQIVEIPWRKSYKQGIISQIHNKDVYPGAKNIHTLLEDTPSFTQNQVNALVSLAEYYFCSPSNLLMQFIPDKPKKQRSERQEPAQYCIPELSVHRSVPEKVKQIISQPQKSQTLKIQSESERFFFIRQLISTKKRVKIICPTYFEAEILYSYLNDKFSEVLLWDNRVGKNQQWEAWQGIKEKKYTIIIGTTAAAFTPFISDAVIIDQQERSEHKRFEGSPALDSRTVARILAKHTNAHLFELAFVPEMNENTPIKLSEKSPYPLFVKHREKKSTFTPDIENSLIRATKEHPAFMVVSSFGAASALYCPECEHTWRCSQCQTKLRVEADKLHCMVCNSQYQLPSRCNGCGGYEIRSVGIGLDGLKNTLKDKYQKEVGIFTASDQMNVVADVILVTPYQLNRLLQVSKEPSLIVLYHPEQLLYSPDYSAQWLFYSYLYWHRAITELYAQCPLYVQTDLAVSHKILQYALSDQYFDFRDEELTQRKQFMHPPYSEYLSVHSPTKLQLPPDFLGPFISKKEGYRYIKKFSTGTLHNLDKILGSSYSKVKIDRNPDRLIFIPKE